MSRFLNCGCVKCVTCGGTGSYAVDIGGKYVGPSRSDDLDYLEHCDQCNGSGIVEECDKCEQARWDEQDDGL